MNAISNEELIDNLIKGKEAHGKWIANLKKIVDEMKVYPIQTNSKKCAFGHFYYSINILIFSYRKWFKNEFFSITFNFDCFYRAACGGCRLNPIGIKTVKNSCTSKLTIAQLG